MSVLVKDMEMPKNCFDCPCYHHKVDDGYYDYEICRASGTVFNDGYASVTGHKDHIDPFKARLDNCPLVPVPPHGRLIDADAFSAKIIEIVEQQKYDDSYAKSLSIGEILREVVHELRGEGLQGFENAPTIIPAEEGE